MGQISCKPHILSLGLSMEGWNPAILSARICQCSWYTHASGIKPKTTLPKERGAIPGEWHCYMYYKASYLQLENTIIVNCSFFKESYICLTTAERCSGKHASLALSLCMCTACNSENKYPTEHIVKKHKCLTGALPQRAEHCVCAIGKTMELTSCLTFWGHDRSMAALVTQNIASEWSQQIYTTSYVLLRTAYSH